MQLVDYELYIISNNFTDTTRSRYYVSWVKRFIRMKLSDQLSNIEKVKQFCESLAIDSSVEEWQLAQAKHAVELYLNMFLKDVHTQKDENAPDIAENIKGLRNALRLKHYSYRTEGTYVDWCRRYLEYCKALKYDPLASSSVKLYLSFLAVNQKVAAATQNQAFNSVLFLFRHVFNSELDDIKGTIRAKAKTNLPAVLSVDEIKQLFKQVEGTPKFILQLIYGTGMRLSEFIRLRVKDIDFENGNNADLHPRHERDFP
ncbi:MAG: phage integrase N-terminal SAM-like domain-containing protein [Kiritimatiellae bacterium]|nr:phage integrase N-terminal SAM-like domain-containing protein [Kiritimatiellia bacterium]